MSRRYTVAAVRERLADALDEAEKGIPVIIERRGVRYRLTLDRPAARRRTRRTPRITVVHPAILDGEWGWAWTADELKFTPRQGRAHRRK